MQLTEEVNNNSQGSVADETFQQVIHFFGEKGIAQIIMLIVVINAWNRIAISTKQVYKEQLNEGRFLFLLS